MGRHRFVTGARFTWQGNTYDITGRLPNDTVQITDVATGAEQAVAELVLRGALFDGDLAFMPWDRRRHRLPGYGGDTAEPLLPWDDYPASLRAIADYRLAILQPL